MMAPIYGQFMYKCVCVLFMNVLTNETVKKITNRTDFDFIVFNHNHKCRCVWCKFVCIVYVLPGQKKNKN